jgi:hypothetical protein
MKTISFEIDDAIFSETEEILSIINKPRNSYINEAIVFYNRTQKRKILEEKLRLESELVRKESMSILKDFEAVDDPIDDSKAIS